MENNLFGPGKCSFCLYGLKGRHYCYDLKDGMEALLYEIYGNIDDVKKYGNKYMKNESSNSDRSINWVETEEQNKQLKDFECRVDAEQKTPFGVIPKHIWLSQRAVELAKSISAYIQCDRVVSVKEWVDELSEIVRILSNK